MGGCGTRWTMASRISWIPTPCLALHSTASLGSTLGPILGVLVYGYVGSRVFVWAAVVGVLATLVGRIGMATPAAVQAVAPDAEPVEPVLESVDSLATEPALAEPVLTESVD